MSTRINVTISDQQHEELRHLAKTGDMDMSEFVRNAIRTYTHLMREQMDGNDIYVGTRNIVKKELILPGTLKAATHKKAAFEAATLAGHKVRNGKDLATSK